jgi:hypothetical protein
MLLQPSNEKGCQMELLGYSERGVVNALFHEIHYSQRSEALLLELLSLVQFPFCSDPMPVSVSVVQVLLEQSFSDFGDADALLLLTTEGQRMAMFLEAKVKNAQKKSWLIEQELDKFRRDMLKGNVNCSNLFAQLYLKVRLVEGLRACTEDDVTSCQARFPPCFKKTTGKIGKNLIVGEAAHRARTHLGESRYIALVPGNPDDIQGFFTKTLVQAGDMGLPGWDVTNWGFLAWEDVKQFCEKNALHNTLAVFDYNAGAVF